MKKIIYYLLFVAVLVGVYFVYAINNKVIPNDSVIATTTEEVVQVVPDEEPVSNIKKVYDKTLGLSYEYIDNFYVEEKGERKLTNYVHPVQWPPQVAVVGKYICKTSEIKNINGKNYCLTTVSEGAVGSTYTTYIYKKVIQNKTISFTFITRVPQCLNYDEPKATECKNEIKNFSVDDLIDKIFDSVKIEK